MAIYNPTFSGSLTLRTSQSQWLGDPNVHVTDPSALTFSQMDFNWWNLYSWSLQMDTALDGVAYVSASNVFHLPQTFSAGFISVPGPNLLSNTTLTNGVSVFGTSAFNNGLTITGSLTAPNITGSLLGTASYSTVAQTASYIDVVGNNITVNWNGSQLQLTGSVDATFSASIAGRATTLEATASNAYVSSTVTGQTITFTQGDGTTESVTITGLVTTASYAVDSASWNSSFAAIPSTYQTIATAAQTESAILNNFLYYVETSSFNAYTASYDAAISGTYATKTELLATQSAILAGVTASANEVRAGVTASLQSYIQNTWTSSVYAVDSASWTTSITNITAWSGSTTSYFAGTSSHTIQADSASYIKTAGLGITTNMNGDVLEITASLRTVNGVNPDGLGNAQVTLAAVQTGTSASLVATSANTLTTGSVWVISGDPDPTKNGDTYIVGLGATPGPNEWYPIAPLDQPAADARYLMLAGTNSPMQGNVNWGGYQINNLGAGILSSDAINLGQLTASIDTLSAGVTASIGAATASLSSSISTTYVAKADYTVDSGSWNTKITDINNWTGSGASTFAGTASYLNILGKDITVNWNGSTVELTGSNVDGFVTTSSFGTYTASMNLFTGSVNATTGALELTTGSLNSTTGSLNTFTGSIELFTGSVNLTTGSLNITTGSLNTFTGSIELFTGSVNITTGSLNTTTGSLLAYTASLNTWTSSVVTNVTFNAFTSSYLADSASFSSSIAESYYSSSISGNTITFNKNNGTTNTIAVPSTDISGLATTASLNAFTASYLIDSASVSASIASIPTIYATKVELNNSSSDLKAGVTASLTAYVQNTWTGSVYNVDSASVSASVAVLHATASTAYVSSSISSNVITFNKGNGTTETITLPASSVVDVSTYLSSSWTGSVFGVYTASINTWTGSNTSVFAGTASFVNVTGSGVLVNWNGSTLQLTASVAAGTPNLQSVTTVGNATSASMQVTGSLTMNGASNTGYFMPPIITVDPATTAPYNTTVPVGAIVLYDNGANIQMLIKKAGAPGNWISII